MTGKIFRRIDFRKGQRPSDLRRTPLEVAATLYQRLRPEDSEELEVKKRISAMALEKRAKEAERGQPRQSGRTYDESRRVYMELDTGTVRGWRLG